jgi:hypothetical protein
VIIVSQRARYRRQASLCYEIAATMSGEKVAAMVHLGDVYSGLADAPDQRWPVPPPADEDAPECPHCRQAMDRMHSLPPTNLLPAREAFRCLDCGESLVCKRA